MGDSQDLLKKALSDVNDIPALPDVVVKVMQLTRNPDVTAEELTTVISKDPALTGNILRLCNSALYGLPRTVSSLKQAVMYLGFHTVRNLVLTCSMSNLFNTDVKIPGYTEGGLWVHSIACAIGCEMICKTIRPIRKAISDAAFTAGLLHDIGQILIGMRSMGTLETIEELMLEGGMSQVEAEKEALGYSHDELGSALLSHWDFPDLLVLGLKYHHFPDRAEKSITMPSLVHITNSLICDMGFGIDLEQMKHTPNEFAIDTVGMDPSDLMKLREDIESMVKENSEMFLQLSG